MTKDELIAVAVERKLVRTKSEARSMKVDALRALVEADARLERDAEDARAERDLREGRDLEEATLVLVDQIRSGELKLGDYVEHPAKFDTLVIQSENPQDVFRPVLADVQCENQSPWPKVPAAPVPVPMPMNRRARRRAAAISRLNERARARAERLGL